MDLMRQIMFEEMAAAQIFIPLGMGPEDQRTLDALQYCMQRVAQVERGVSVEEGVSELPIHEGNSAILHKLVEVALANDISFEEFHDVLQTFHDSLVQEVKSGLYDSLKIALGNPSPAQSA